MIDELIRGFYYIHKGEEKTSCFIVDKSLVADYVNLAANAISAEYLESYVPCKLIGGHINCTSFAKNIQNGESCGLIKVIKK